MKCSKCVEMGLRSIVQSGFVMSTCMYFAPFYDEDGNYHNHDNNTQTQNWNCSNNHYWTTTQGGSCGCGWKGTPIQYIFSDESKFRVITA